MNGFLIVLFSLLFLAFAAARVAKSKALQEKLAHFRRRGLMLCLAFVLIVGSTYVAGMKNMGGDGLPKDPNVVLVGGGTTASAGMKERVLLGLPSPPPNRLSQAQYGSGLALVAVAKPSQGWTNMPVGAVQCWTGGVSEAVFWLPMAGWRFPVRGLLYDGAYIFSSGVVSLGDLCPDELDGLPLPDGAVVFPVLAVLKGRFGIAPNVGKFWYYITQNNSIVMTWDTVYLNRDSAYPATIQCELYRNGDMAFRYALLDANADYSAVLADFHIGAQNNGAGEGTQLEFVNGEQGITNADIFNLRQPNANPLELELRWRGFGVLDPDAPDGDSDSDGLTDWEEIFIFGTNPLNRDTDGDGISDLWEVARELDPLNPDSDFDDAVDGDDPDPDSTYGGQDHADWLFRVINRLPDNEPLPYTPPNLQDWFKVTVTLNAPLSPPAVLWFGEGKNARRVLLRETGAWEVWLNKGWDTTLRIASTVPCGPDFTLTTDDSEVVIQHSPPDWLERERNGEIPVPGNGGNGPSGGNGGNSGGPGDNGNGPSNGDGNDGYPVPDPASTHPPGPANPGTGPWNPDADPTHFGAVGIPTVSVNPSQHCFHSTGPKSFGAVVTPKFKGKGKWTYSGKVKYGDVVTYTPDFINQPGSIFLEYTLDGTGITIPASAALTYCSDASGHDPDEEDDDWGWMWWRYCPNMISCAGDWCAFCNAYWFHYHHPFDPEWPSGYCPLCGYGYYGYYYYYYDSHYPCPEHPCWAPPELCASDDEGGIRFRTNYHRDFPDDETMIYPVPGNHPGGCCPCPEHNIIRITDGRLVSASGVTCWRKDLNGDYTQIAADSPVGAGEAVYVRGTYLSNSPWDRMAIFDWKDYGNANILTCKVSVASVRLVPNVGTVTESIKERLAFPPEGGVLSAAVGTLHPVYLLCDASLTGDFILSMSGDPGVARLWLTDSTAGTPLLVAGQTVTDGMPVTFADPGGTADVWLEVVKGGNVTITFSFEGTGYAKGINHSDTLKVKTARFGMVPDYDRDGKINAADAAQLPKPFRIWLNDDFDWGDIGNEISGIPGYYSGSSVNSGYPHVCGRYDLPDFFPVWLDVGELLAAEPTATLRLKHKNSCINVVLTSLTTSTAREYLTVSNNTYGTALDQFAHEADKLIPPHPLYYIELPTAFLNMVRNDPTKGVILIEGWGDTADSNPLILEAVKDNAVIMRAELPLRVSHVENMFSHLNIRGVSPVFIPAAFPPDCIGKHVFFTHGFLVTEQESRAWGAKTFKKLYQSGMNAKFTMVTWSSDTGPTISYEDNVIIGFQAAQAYAAHVNGVKQSSGDEVIVMAHSLGNILTSAAICDHGMLADKYFAFNAAVPAEAFAPGMADVRTNEVNRMLHMNWRGYKPETWAANWHQLFKDPYVFPNDDRKHITWRGRFAAATPILYNFWSSEDEVLEIAQKDIDAFNGIEWEWKLSWWPVSMNARRYVWHKQALFKGRSWLYGTQWAGWGFWRYMVPLTGRVYSMKEANELDYGQLRVEPVFRHYPSAVFEPADVMLPLTIETDMQYALLARGIPELSYNIGVTPVDGINQPGEERNINMHTDLKRVDGDWPQRAMDFNDDNQRPKRWLHSDLMDVAYFYTHRLFERIVDEGNMKGNPQ